MRQFVSCSRGRITTRDPHALGGRAKARLLRTSKNKKTSTQEEARQQHHPQGERVDNATQGMKATPHATRHPTRRLEDSSTTQERIAAPRQKKGEEAPLPEKEEGEHHLSNAERKATLLQKRKVTTPPKNRDETGFHNLGGEKPRPRPRRERPPPPPDAGGETTITP